MVAGQKEDADQDQAEKQHQRDHKAEAEYVVDDFLADQRKEHWRPFQAHPAPSPPSEPIDSGDSWNARRAGGA